MSGRRAPAGFRIAAWVGRRLGAGRFETVILPAIADVQHEDSESVGRPAVVRWAIRLRGYAGLCETLGACLIDRGGPSASAAQAAGAPAAAGFERSSVMSDSATNPLLMVGAGVLVAAVGFLAGRMSVVMPPAGTVSEPSAWQAADGPGVNRAVPRSVGLEGQDAAERDSRLQQELDHLRSVAEAERVKAERARIDAETEAARLRTQYELDQRAQAAELERIRLESARRDAYLELARQRTQQMLDETIRRR